MFEVRIGATTLCALLALVPSAAAAFPDAIAPEHPESHLLPALTLLDPHPERRHEDLAVLREARERLGEELASTGEPQ